MRRQGLNFDCTWVPDPAAPVDLRVEAQAQHVLEDIRAADELAMRYGDRMAGTRLVETFGIVSRHGGTKDRDLGRRSRQECTARLFPQIASTHGLTVADLERLRPRLAERGLDWPVSIPVVLILGFAVRRFMCWIPTRFAPDERAGWIVATLFASLLIPLVTLALGGGWAMVVEIVRLGNEHVGNRGHIANLRPHAIAAIGLGVASVWIASGITAWQESRRVARG